MTTDPLDQLWQSPANQPSPSVADRLVRGFLTDLRRRRRWHAVWLAWTLLVLTAVTVLAVAQLSRLESTALLAAWPMGLMLAGPWFVALRFLRSFITEKTFPTPTTQPWSAALAAVVDQNLAARRRLAWIAGLFAVMIPISGFAIVHLHATGKTTPGQAWSMVLFFAVALAAGGAFMLWTLVARLRPEQRRLTAHQRALAATPQP